jgi:hypothetical protein
MYCTGYAYRGVENSLKKSTKNRQDGLQFTKDGV